MTTILQRIDSLAADLAEITKRTPAKHRQRIAQIADLVGVALDFAHDGGAAQIILSEPTEDASVTPVTSQPQHRQVVIVAEAPPAAPPNRRRLPMYRLIAFVATQPNGVTIEEASRALGVSYVTMSSKLKLAWQSGRLSRGGHPLRYYAVAAKEPLPELPYR